MKKSTVVLAIIVGVIMSSCAFTTTCPTYSKHMKDSKEIKKSDRRI